MPVHVTCLQCGTPFLANTTKAKAGTAKYCSQACYGAARRSHRVPLICRHCAQSFAVVACYAKRGQYLYCSRACYAAARTPTPKPPRPTRDEVFDSRVAHDEGCWEWMGGRYPNGYGQCASGQRSRSEYAHRRAWERASGEPIPDGMGVYHTCDNPPCVRNDDAGTYEVDGRLLPRWGHLFLGTDADNMADKVAKGRQRRGATAPNAILTEALVLEIHRLWATHSITMTAMAERLGVHRITISDVLNGRTWTHLLPPRLRESERIPT